MAREGILPVAILAEGAIFRGAIFREAIFRVVSFQGGICWGKMFRGAIFQGAIFLVPIMSEISIQDLESCNKLITYLITLRSILKDTVKIKKILELKIKKLEQKEINELKEKIFIMTLRNKYLGKLSYDIDEEKIDLIKQAKKKIDKIEELKKDLMGESKAAKMLQDLEYEIAGILKKLINYLKEQLKNI